MTNNIVTFYVQEQISVLIQGDIREYYMKLKWWKTSKIGPLSNYGQSGLICYSYRLICILKFLIKC